MVKIKSGLSREFIIHPGETLKEVIEDRNMSQRELAFRTDVKESHVSSIIRGKKGISISYAKKLEYALNIDSSFWINLQSSFENELQDFEEFNKITEEEMNIIKGIKELIKYGQELTFISKDLSKQQTVIELRKKLNVSNLLSIPQLMQSGAFRISENHNIDNYTLFTWLRLCDLITSQENVETELNKDTLINKLDQIKMLMFKDFKTINDELKIHLSECGIKFAILKHFAGAPIQGVIKKDNEGSVNLVMTVRQKYADIFWFTFFHEIGHIIHDDFDGNRIIDYEFNKSEMEDNANKFAADILIDPEKYELFLSEQKFNISSIKSFCLNEQIPEYVLVGRLQKENHLKYNQLSELKVKYNIDDIK